MYKIQYWYELIRLQTCQSLRVCLCVCVADAEPCLHNPVAWVRHLEHRQAEQEPVSPALLLEGLRKSSATGLGPCEHHLPYHLATTSALFPFLQAEGWGGWGMEGGLVGFSRLDQQEHMDGAGTIPGQSGERSCLP